MSNVINFDERFGRPIRFILCDIRKNRAILIARDENTEELVMYHSYGEFDASKTYHEVREVVKIYNDNMENWEVVDLGAYLSSEMTNKVLGWAALDL